MRRGQRFPVILLLLVLLLAVGVGVWWLWFSGDHEDFSRHRDDKMSGKETVRTTGNDGTQPREDARRPGASEADTRERESPRKPRTSGELPPDPADAAMDGADQDADADPSLLSAKIEWDKITTIRFIVPVVITVDGKAISQEPAASHTEPWRDHGFSLQSHLNSGVFQHVLTGARGKRRIVLSKAVSHRPGESDTTKSPALFTTRILWGVDAGRLLLTTDHSIEDFTPAVREVLLKAHQHAEPSRASLRELRWELTGGADAAAVAPADLGSPTIEVRRNDAVVVFRTLTIGIEETLDAGALLVTGTLIDPASKAPVLLLRGDLTPVPMDETSARLRIPVIGRDDGRFVGVLPPSPALDAMRASGRAGEFAIGLQGMMTEPHRETSTVLEQNLHPLPLATMSNDRLNFGIVEWPGHLVLARVDRDSEPFRQAGLAADQPIDLSPRSGQVSRQLITDQGRGFPLFAVALTSSGVEFNARVRGRDSLSFTVPKVGVHPKQDRIEIVDLVPNWSHVIRIHVTHKGEKLDSAFVLPIPADNEKNREAAAQGRIPDEFQNALVGFGRIDPNLNRPLPYPLALNPSNKNISGYWVAAVSDGLGTALQWVPSDHTKDVTIELGHVSDARRVSLVVNMPTLASDSIPGAATAREQGWLGTLQYRIQVISEGDRRPRDLGVMDVSNSGRGQMFAHLDPAREWKVMLLQHGGSARFRPLHDLEIVHEVPSARIPAAQPEDEAAPELDLGTMPAPRLIARWNAPDNPYPDVFKWTCDGAEYALTSPRFCYFDGGFCAPAGAIPPAYWDGAKAVAIQYELPRDAASTIGARIDLPVRAHVQTVWNEPRDCSVTISAEHGSWERNTMAHIQQPTNGRIHRVWAPIGSRIRFSLQPRSGRAAIVEAEVKEGIVTHVTLTLP